MGVNGSKCGRRHGKDTFLFSSSGHFSWAFNPLLERQSKPGLFSWRYVCVWLSGRGSRGTAGSGVDDSRSCWSAGIQTHSVYWWETLWAAAAAAASPAALLALTTQSAVKLCRLSFFLSVYLQGRKKTLAFFFFCGRRSVLFLHLDHFSLWFGASLP